jgi:hypothetical protein
VLRLTPRALAVGHTHTHTVPPLYDVAYQCSFFSRLSDEVNTVFGDITPRSSVNNTSLSTTRRPFPEDSGLEQHRCRNLESCTVSCWRWSNSVFCHVTS